MFFFFFLYATQHGKIQKTKVAQNRQRVKLTLNLFHVKKNK